MLISATFLDEYYSFLATFLDEWMYNYPSSVVNVVMSHVLMDM